MSRKRERRAVPAAAARATPEPRAAARRRVGRMPAAGESRTPAPETPPAGENERLLRAMEAWRLRIDAVDARLLRLLNERSGYAVEIGRVKRELGLAIYSPEREAWILERVMRDNPGPLDPLAVRRVFERVIDESRRLERLAAEREAAEQAAVARKKEE